MKQINRLFIRSGTKITLIRFGLLYAIGCTILMTKFLISALLTDGTATLEFNRYGEMDLESVLMPICMIITIISIYMIWQKLSIEYNSTCYELSQRYKQESEVLRKK